MGAVFVDQQPREIVVVIVAGQELVDRVAVDEVIAATGEVVGSLRVANERGGIQIGIAANRRFTGLLRCNRNRRGRCRHPHCRPRRTTCGHPIGFARRIRILP